MRMNPKEKRPNRNFKMVESSLNHMNYYGWWTKFGIKKTDRQIFKNKAIFCLQEISPKRKDPGKMDSWKTEKDIEPKDSCIVIVIFSTVLEFILLSL